MSSYAAYAASAKPDPALANIGPARVKAIIAQALGKMPAVKTPEQIATEAGGIVTPQIDAQVKSITDAISARAKASQLDITNYTNAAQKQMGDVPGKVASTYGAAEQARLAVERALEGDSARQGASITGDLGARLAAINAGTDGGAGVVANAGALAGGITGGVKERGAADLERLINTAKGEGTYALALPGLLGLSGTESSRKVGEQAVQDVSTGTKSITDAAPATLAQIAAALTTANDTNTSDRAKLYTQLYGDLLNLNTQRGIARQGYQTDVAKVNATVAGTQARTAAAAVKAAAGEDKTKQKALVNAQNALNRLTAQFREGVASHVSQPKTDAFGKIVVDATGKPILTSTTVYKRIPYYQAIRQAEQAIGAYLSPYAQPALIVRMAQQFVNPLYPAGMFGRPGNGPGPGETPTAGGSPGPR